MTTVTSSATGGITGTFTVPSGTPGNGYIIQSAPVGLAQYGATSFKLASGCGTGTIALEPLTGSGAQVAVSGVYFGANEQVSIKWPGGKPTITVTTSANGEFDYASMTIPTAQSGIYPITANGKTSGDTAG